MVNIEQENKIYEKDINTRKELWDSLFAFTHTDNFASTTQYKGKKWPLKDSNLFPLPGTYKLAKTILLNKIKAYDEKITNLINSWQPYFIQNIIPLLENNLNGDKPLAFHTKRLLDFKIVGVVPGLFKDLVIFEVEYRQVEKFKELLPKLNDWVFNKEHIQQQWKSDLEKMKNGRIDYSVASKFWWKWGNKVGLPELVQEINDYLKLWQQGKGAESEWKSTLDNFASQLDNLFCVQETKNIAFLNFGKIKKSEDYWITVTTQNKAGWDLNDPAILVFWLWQKSYRAYRIRGFRYLDLNYLFVELTLEEDWLWKNYEKSMVSGGTLKSGDHPLYIDAVSPQGEKKLHYPFCGDLGDKEVYHLDTNYQPKWQLYTINHPNWMEKITDGGAAWFAGEGNFVNFFGTGDEMKFPSNLYKIEKYNKFWTGLSKNDILLLLCPEDFYTGGSLFGVGTQTSNCFYEKSGEYYFELATQDHTTDPPKQVDPQSIQKISSDLAKYNHLVDHSTFQFCFNRETIFPANLRYLNFCQENDKWLIKYFLKIRATPAGIYYTFNSGTILWQLKIEVKQSVPSNKTLKKLLTAAMVVVTVTGAFMLAGAIGAGGAGLADGSALNAIKGDLNKLNQTNQLLSGAKSILPDSEDKISYSFSLFDFWSKLWKNKVFWGKIHVSNTLKNNLAHNNNENPITYPLNITFPRLDEIIRKGDWQGELRPIYDPYKYLETKFRQGLRFYEDMDKDFPRPNLGIIGATNLITLNMANAEGYVAEEIRDGFTVEVNRTKGTNFHQRAHFFITYEDGSKEHWLVLFPQSFTDSDLAEGHAHGGFDLKFDKPVKEFIDVYACIGCGARDQGYTVLHPGYDDGSADSLDWVNKGLPYEPWFSEFTQARLQNDKWMCPGRKCLGSVGDVWEFTGQYIRDEQGRSFQEAYGFIPQGGTIRWRIGSTSIRFQRLPGRDDFEGMDWSHLQGGGGGDIEIPLNDPEINLPEPDVNDIPIDPSIEIVPDFDPGGREPEIVPIEVDIVVDTDTPEDDFTQDFDPPPVEVVPPEPDPNDLDQGQDPEGGEVDPPEIDVFNSDDND